MARFIPIFLSLFLLSACAETQLAAHVAKQVPGVRTSGDNTGVFKVGNPYVIAGKRYYPAETYSFSQTGIASWYGPAFHGKPTANGDVFDMYELTAAHKTLQMPSMVRVTNLENGRSLIVRVNDRGPFSKGRIIDLSKRGAELLGFKNKGTARVKVQVLPEESRKVAEMAQRGQDTRGTEVVANENRFIDRTGPSATPETDYTRVASLNTPEPVSGEMLSPPGGADIMAAQSIEPAAGRVTASSATTGDIFVQAGAFTDPGRAKEMANAVSTLGEARVYPAVVRGQKYYRVRLGPVSSEQGAEMLIGRLEGLGRAADPMIIIE